MILTYSASTMTISHSGSVYGYDADAGFGSLVSTVFNTTNEIDVLVDDGTNITLELADSDTTLPDRIYLELFGTEYLLERATDYSWVGEGSPFTDTLFADVEFGIGAPAYGISLVSIDMTDNGGDVFRMCTAAYDVVYDGNTYQASGDLLKIESLSESADLISSGVELTLNGVDPAYRSEIESNRFRRAPIDILTAILPEGTNEVVEAAYWHRGYCDTPTTKVDYTSDPNMMTIGMETVSVFGNLYKVPDLCRTSQSSHSARHDGDLFFKYVASTTNEETWKK